MSRLDRSDLLPDAVRLPARLARPWFLGAAAIAALAALATAGGAVVAPRRFAFSYLTAFSFVLSLAVGGLFWAMIHHLTAAVWSVVVRRFAEHLARPLPWLALAFLPLVWGTARLYSWAAPAHRAAKAGAGAIAGHGSALRAAWLNVPFFWARSAVYLAAWALLATMMVRLSAAQDKGGDGAAERTDRRMRAASAPGMVVLGLTTTFAAFDWLMSLESHWVSTMFGVYFWVASILGSMAALTLMVLGLQAAGWLRQTITAEHLHDLGKLLFTFVIFWAYIAYSQYFLIWYANQPEETIWYIERRAGGWGAVGQFLILGHFLVPFFWLLPRSIKRSPAALGLAAGWILLVHYVDFYWLIMPVACPEGPRPHWLDLTTLAALTAGYAAVVVRALVRCPLVPVGDPRLAESIAFHNI